jgi:hypothetical protein
MQCNINARGKAVRLISGIVVTLLGLILLVMMIGGLFAGGAMWALTAVVLAAGLFQIYEGWAGWCVLRAMGFKTPV